MFKNDLSKKLLTPIIVIACTLLLSASIISCYKAPVTGRNQFIILSQSQENEMGLTAFNEVLKSEEISNNQSYNDAVTRVGQRIAAVSHTQGYEWDFKVIEDDEQINAFALPGARLLSIRGYYRLHRLMPDWQQLWRMRLLMWLLAMVAREFPQGF